jgi:UDP-GlcNAc:undecaprenyl-phosphate GlcNAc-1-phosphate transferase
LPTQLWAATLPLGLAFLATWVLVPQVRKFAIECRVADKPNGRKLHAHAIPHLGGVAIFSGFFLALLSSLATEAASGLAGRVLALLPALLILFGLGLVDDLRGLRASVKLVYQSLGATCVVAMGVGFPAHPGAPALEFAAVAAVSVFWYVGVCNSINLIDGLDGLAAGTSVLASLGFLVVALRVGDAAVAVVALALVGALVAFLRFNFHPARIFMGDTGSMFLGFTLAALACLLAQKLGFWTAILGSAALLGLPVTDTAAAICRRVAAGRHIFEADGEHTHHRLMRAGLSHRAAVLVLYAIQSLFVVLGCGVLLGRTAWFATAVVLGIGTAVTVSRLARRVPLAAPLARPAASRRPVVAPLEPATVHVLAAAPHRISQRSEIPGEEVLASFPPAAARPS